MTTPTRLQAAHARRWDALQTRASIERGGWHDLTLGVHGTTDTLAWRRVQPLARDGRLSTFGQGLLWARRRYPQAVRVARLPA